MNFKTLQTLAYKVQNNNAADITAYIDDMLTVETGKHWVRDLLKLRATVGDEVARFSIFALDGNKKLPFVSFATLPGVTCPGAGDCTPTGHACGSERFKSVDIIIAVH